MFITYSGSGYPLLTLSKFTTRKYQFSSTKKQIMSQRSRLVSESYFDFLCPLVVTQSPAATRNENARDESVRHDDVPRSSAKVMPTKTQLPDIPEVEELQKQNTVRYEVEKANKGYDNRKEPRKDAQDELPTKEQAIAVSKPNLNSLEKVCKTSPFDHVPDYIKRFICTSDPDRPIYDHERVLVGMSHSDYSHFLSQVLNQSSFDELTSITNDHSCNVSGFRSYMVPSKIERKAKPLLFFARPLSSLVSTKSYHTRLGFSWDSQSDMLVWMSKAQYEAWHNQTLLVSSVGFS